MYNFHISKETKDKLLKRRRNEIEGKKLFFFQQNEVKEKAGIKEKHSRFKMK